MDSAREVENNIISSWLQAVLLLCMGVGVITQKGKVSRVLEQFFYDIAKKPTLNHDLLSHSVAMWAHGKNPSPWDKGMKEKKDNFI